MKKIKLNLLLKNKTFNNGIWLYLLQIFNTLIPLLTLPYVTRVLGAAEYGVFVVALNLINYFQVLVDYGFNLSATRKVALDDNTNKLNKLFTVVFASKQLLLLISFISLIIIAWLLNYPKDQFLAITVLFLNLIGYSLQQNWLFQGLEEMKFISIVNITGRIVSLVFTFLLVNDPKDLLLYCLLYSLSPFVSGVLGLIVIKIKFNIKFVRISFKNIMNELKDGFYIFSTSFSSKIFGSIGITFLGILSNPNTVGIYSAINKIPNILMLIWLPISQIMYPISSKKFLISKEDGKKFLHKTSIVIFPVFISIGLLIAVFSKPLILILFGKEYADFYYWIFPLLFWLILSIYNNFNGIQILLANGYDKEYSKSFQIGIISTIILNFTLIYFMGGDGAALAPFISELILAVSLQWQIKKVCL